MHPNDCQRQGLGAVIWVACNLGLTPAFFVLGLFCLVKVLYMHASAVSSHDEAWGVLLPATLSPYAQT